jgi:CheY-like chemotaxis protein/transposase-like protein
VADSSQTPAYSISAVARMLGISPSALRTWEERYGTVIPARSKGSQRLYSRAQVDQLLFVKGQLDEGIQLSQAFRMLAERLEIGVHPTAAQVMPPRHPILILLAERDPYAAELEEYFLRTEGYDVRVALSTAEAERLLTDQSPEVVIVDLLISGNQGLDFCRRIRKHGEIHVLAVAAMDLGDEALAAGAEAFLQKPLAPLQLVSTVKDLLGTSALARLGARTPAR